MFLNRWIDLLCQGFCFVGETWIENNDDDDDYDERGEIIKAKNSCVCEV